MIYKTERRKYNVLYNNCSLEDPVSLFFFSFISNPLKCEATSQKHGGLLRERKNTTVGSFTSAKMNQKTQLLNQMLTNYKNQQLYSKAIFHIAKTTTKLSKNCLENVGAVILMFQA